METSESEVEETTDAAIDTSAEDVDTTVDAEADADVTPDGPDEPAFDWGAWDGTLDAVPEAHREIAGHVAGYYSPKLEKLETLRQQNEQLNELLDAISVGQEDPRIQELTAAQAKVQQDYEAMQREYGELQQAIEAQNDKAAEQYAEWFQQEYAQFWENPELGAMLGQLIDAEWEPAVAAESLLLGAKGLEIVADAIARGVPGDFALDHARQVLATETRHTPSPAAELVSGGGAPAQRGQAADYGLGDVNTLEDRRNVIAMRAFKKHGLI